MEIRILPSNLINQIAAGEVIERPSSAIKELVENSIDAGATSIAVQVRDGGKSYIAVSDNGTGMSAKDLAICTLRHATSKLPEEDLFNIKTLGFRGEALPSIGSVARLKITSKHKDEEHAWCLNVEGGTTEDIEPASLAKGTKIEVSDLFFATPARLKFLKSAQTENNYTIDVIKRLAMANPHVAFSMTDGTKNFFNYPAIGNPDDKDALLKRLGAVMGEDFQKNAIVVDLEQQDFSLKGYAGLPTLNRGNAQQQFLFVNGRPVKDKILNHGVKVAYADFLATNRFPYVCLFLEISPEMVDMNVHPAKVEVRFRDPGKVRNIIISALKNAIKSAGFRASTTVADMAIASAARNTDPTSIQPHLVIRPQSQGGNNPSGTSFAQGMKTFSGTTSGVSNYRPTNFSAGAPITSMRDFAALAQAPQQMQESHRMLDSSVEVTNDNLETTETNSDDFAAYPLGLARAQLHDTYVIAESKSGIVIVDQHAVHERIVYEKLKTGMAEGGVSRQGLLVPEIIDLSEAQQQRLLDAAPELEQLGLVIEGFGGSSVIVRETPAILKQGDVKSLVLDIVDELDEIGSSSKLKESIGMVLATIACHGSIRAGRKMSILEMNELLRQMESTPFSGQCNHGRPTYVELKKTDIEKLFGRA